MKNSIILSFGQIYLHNGLERVAHNLPIFSTNKMKKYVLQFKKNILCDMLQCLSYVHYIGQFYQLLTVSRVT